MSKHLSSKAISYKMLSLPDDFLSRIVAELNSEMVTALVLTGSYARGTATTYSDIDVLRFVREIPERKKEYIYREGYLIGISTRTPEQYLSRFTRPEEAIFVIPSIREARVLIDKEEQFAKLQQKAQLWTWEPLQAAANDYAGEIMMIQAEIVHKTLRAIQLKDELALSEMILLLFLAVTDALTVQHGILAKSGNTYFQQIQESIGLDSLWTHYHTLLAGVKGELSLKEKSIIALRLYQETARLLLPNLYPQHLTVVEQTVAIIEQALSH